MAKVVDFQRVFEGSVEAQLLLASDSTVLGVTDGYVRSVGLERDRAVGRKLTELPPYAEMPAAAVRRLLEEIARVWTSGVQFAHPLGGGFTSAAVTFPVADADGVQSVVHAVGLQRRSEPLTSEGDRRLRKLVEHSYDSLVLLDQSGRPFYASPATKRVRGYEPEELLRLNLIGLIHPEDLPRFGAAIQKLLAEPGGLTVNQYRARHGDGHWQTLESVAVNHLDDPDILAIVVLTRDISQRVALEETLRQRNEELRLALGAARAISWDTDVATPRTVRYSSDPAEFFGHSYASAPGLDVRNAVHPEDREMVSREVQRAFDTGGEIAIEFRGLTSQGQVRHYIARGRALRDESNQPFRLAGVTWDVTDRRRIEAEREQLHRRIQEGQKLESLGILAGGIAHDFNNILTAILGNASLARLALSETSPATPYLDQIEEASRRATDLCKQMLAYAGKGRFVLQRVNVDKIVEDTTHLLQVSISKKAVLRFHLDGHLPPIVADVTQIRQVLMNLVINASDAIGERSGVISISTGVVRADRSYLDKTLQAKDIAPGDYVYVEVSDTGVGMTPDIQTRIFEPFFTSKFTGRGLGLAAVSGIVQGHKGALKVYSEPGKGSSFKLLLPVAPTETTGASPSLVHQPPPRASGGTILVVDDEETIQAVAARMLELLGFRVLLASDGRQALSIYQERGKEIRGVLMDLTMPHLDGEETFRELRRIAPDVRVLLMSGYNEQDAIARFVGKGLAGFIQKPFNIDDLQTSLRALLD